MKEKCIGHPGRKRISQTILSALSKKDEYLMNLPGLWKDVKALENQGYITMSRHGDKMLCAITDKGRKVAHTLIENEKAS